MRDCRPLPFRIGSAAILACAASCSTFGEAVDRTADGSADATTSGANADAANAAETGPPPCDPNAAGCVRYVFVSSQVWDGNLGGISGADTNCQGVASNNGTLTIKARSKRFRAWLSDSVIEPKDRFARDSRPVVLPSGTVVAKDANDFIDGMLTVPLLLTEGGNPVTAPPHAWTGTFANGTRHSKRCDEWKSNNFVGRLGNPTLIDAGWSNFDDSQCNIAHHLYCIEQ